MTNAKTPRFKDTRKAANHVTFKQSMASVIDKRDVITGEPRNRFERRVMASTKKRGA